MDWKDLSGSLIGAGLPILGRMIGGTLLPIGGGEIGAALGAKIAGALGVESKPEAVNAALTQAEDPAVTVERLKVVEIEAAARWPALAEMARARTEADTAQFIAQIDDIKNARGRDLELRKTTGGVNTRANILIFLGFFYVIGATTFIFFNIQELSSVGAVAVLTFLTTTMGTAMGWIGSVYNFEFGSSRSSGEKSDQIIAMAGNAADVAKVAAAKK